MRSGACACPSRCTRPTRIPCTWFDGDGYIAFRSCPADLSAVADYLDRAFG
jgi:hypothetical protein